MSNSKPKIKNRKSSLTPVSDVLQSLLQNSKSGLGEDFKRLKLWSRWAEVVGPTMGKSTAPVAYQKGRLYVWVENSVKLQELSFINESIRKKINEFIGGSWVKKIQFTLDRKSLAGLDQDNPELKKILK